MDASTLDIVNNRALPILNEVFDGFVLVGYHTDKDGRRGRVVLFNNTADSAGKTKDASIVDGLAVPLAQGVHWANGSGRGIG